MVGFSDIVCGRYTASALHTVSCPASRRACSRLDDIEPFRFDSFTYACDASGIVAPIAGSRHRHSRTPSSFRHPSTPEAPFLDRHYPASSVVRASPPPWRPGLPLTGFRLVRAHHRQGFPCCHVFPLPYMPTPLPRRKRSGAPVASLPGRRRPSPFLGRVGFRVALFEACSAFALAPACMVAEPPEAAL